MTPERPVTFCIWTEDGPGIVLRLTTLFTRRKLSITSITASETEEEGIGRFTIVVGLDWALAQKIARQIERVVEVHRVQVCTDDQIVHKEVAFFRLDAAHAKEIEGCVSRHGAKIANKGQSALIVEQTGNSIEIEALRRELEPFGLQEFLRSGRIAMKV